jgi:hypothetical protein
MPVEPEHPHMHSRNMDDIERNLEESESRRVRQEEGLASETVTEAKQDPYLVTFDGRDDPLDAHNWSYVHHGIGGRG